MLATCRTFGSSLYDEWYAGIGNVNAQAKRQHPSPTLSVAASGGGKGRACSLCLLGYVEKLRPQTRVA